MFFTFAEAIWWRFWTAFHDEPTSAASWSTAFASCASLVPPDWEMHYMATAPGGCGFPVSIINTPRTFCPAMS